VRREELGKENVGHTLPLPYPRRMLSNKRHICNTDFCTQKSVECAFCILSAKFKVFEGPVCYKEGTVDSIVEVSAVLHSF
jgi:hypothetical protein